MKYSLLTRRKKKKKQYWIITKAKSLFKFLLVHQSSCHLTMGQIILWLRFTTTIIVYHLRVDFWWFRTILTETWVVILFFSSVFFRQLYEISTSDDDRFYLIDSFLFFSSLNWIIQSIHGRTMINIKSNPYKRISKWNILYVRRNECWPRKFPVVN